MSRTEGHPIRRRLATVATLAGVGAAIATPAVVFGEGNSASVKPAHSITAIDNRQSRGEKLVIPQTEVNTFVTSTAMKALTDMANPNSGWNNPNGFDEKWVFPPKVTGTESDNIILFKAKDNFGMVISVAEGFYPQLADTFSEKGQAQ